MKIRFIYPFLFLIFPIFIAAGTTGKIKGLVLDKETNSPIIGANVFLESTTLGTVTDENGNYFQPKAYKDANSIDVYRNWLEQGLNDFYSE